MNLFRIIGPQYLRLWTQIALIFLTLPLLGPTLGMSKEMLAGLPAFLALGLILGGIFFQNNQSWIISLPLSKVQIVRVAFSLAGLNFILFLLTLSAYFLLFSIRFSVPFSNELLRPLTPSPESGPSGFSGENWLQILLALSFQFFCIFVPMNQRNLMNKTKNFSGMASKSAAWKKFIPAGVGLYLANLADSPFLFLGMGFSISTGIGLMFMSQTLSLYPRAKRRIFGVFGVFTLALLGAVFAQSQNEIRSGSPDKVIRSIAFLGGLAPEISSQRLTQVLNLVLDERELMQLLKDHPDAVKGVNPIDWLKSISRPALLQVLEGRLDPKNLKTEDVHAILDHYAEINRDTSPSFLAQLSQAPFEAKDVSSLIESEDSNTYALGLSICQRRLYPECNPLIVTHLKKLSDARGDESWLIRASMITLSILRAKWLGYEGFMQIRSGQESGLKSSFTPPDCSLFKDGIRAKYVSIADAGSLNYCLRKMQLGQGNNLSSLGSEWIFGNTEWINRSHWPSPDRSGPGQ